MVTVSSFVPALLSKLPTFTFHASQCHSSVHGLLSHTKTLIQEQKACMNSVEVAIIVQHLSCSTAALFWLASTWLLLFRMRVQAAVTDSVSPNDVAAGVAQDVAVAAVSAAEWCAGSTVVQSCPHANEAV
jgi:uncharacterized membrane protein (GlpM family)